MAAMKYNVDTPERIIKAATSLFARHGHRAVTLKDVAREAKVNGAAVNYHFGDKAKLYRAVIDHCLAEREGGGADRRGGVATAFARSKGLATSSR